MLVSSLVHYRHLWFCSTLLMCNCMVGVPLPLPTHTLVQIISNSSFLSRARLQLQKSEHPGNFPTIFILVEKCCATNRSFLSGKFLRKLFFEIFKKSSFSTNLSWVLDERDEQWTLWKWQSDKLRIRGGNNFYDSFSWFMSGNWKPVWIYDVSTHVFREITGRVLPCPHKF